MLLPANDNPAQHITDTVAGGNGNLTLQSFQITEGPEETTLPPGSPTWWSSTAREGILAGYRQVFPWSSCPGSLDFASSTGLFTIFPCLSHTQDCADQQESEESMP